MMLPWMSQQPGAGWMNPAPNSTERPVLSAGIPGDQKNRQCPGGIDPITKKCRRPTVVNSSPLIGGPSALAIQNGMVGPPQPQNTLRKYRKV